MAWCKWFKAGLGILLAGQYPQNSACESCYRGIPDGGLFVDEGAMYCTAKILENLAWGISLEISVDAAVWAI